MKSTAKLGWSLLVAVAMTGCTESGLVETESDGGADMLSAATAGGELSAAKGGNAGGNAPGGGGNDGVPSVVTLSYPSGAPANALVDPDNYAGSFGDGYSFGFGYDLVTGEFGGEEAVSAACPADYRFGLMEVGGKGGWLDAVVLRGQDLASGDGFSSNKINIATPIQPDSENGFTLNVDSEITVFVGKGKNAPAGCTVYVEDLVYTPAAP